MYYFLMVFNPLYRKGQSEELVQHTLSLDDQLMYAVNPELYLSGVGYGSSYIAELYQLGGVLALIIGSYLIGRIINGMNGIIISHILMCIFLGLLFHI